MTPIANLQLTHIFTVGPRTSMSYFDNEDSPNHSVRSSHSGSTRRSNQGSSYTDRFRTDVPFSQPVASASIGASSNSSRHGDGPRGEEVSIGQILALIDRATSANHKQPDLYLNLQIADLVNEKKGNASREVAMKLAKLANSPVVMTAVLALSVLDVCVKNCGYPFHLAISRRDFLNLLVRRFPERPPLNYTRVQTLILEMLEEWNATLVKTSRYRDDLGFIRDMHRLLSYKGYIFPEVSAEELAALAPEQDTLKSAAELEREDREAQSAKLQELIRSGTPQDLKEANKLMSIMAGFRETRVDYNAKVAAELDKIRRKADILAEMLQQAADSGTMPQGGADDVFTELTQSLKAALPKINHILADEEAMEEDEEAKEKIVSLREKVESVLLKHNAVVGGDPNAASLSISGNETTSSQLASLIDIGDENDATTSASPSATANTSNPQDDLLGLSLGGLTLGSASSSQPANTSDILSLSVSPTSTGEQTQSKCQQARSDDFSDPFAAFSANTETSPRVPVNSLNIDSNASNEKPVYSDETLSITYVLSKNPGLVEVDLIFSNPSLKKITNLEIQLAPPKSLKMEIGPLSSTQLEPHQSDGIRQHVTLRGTATPKLRWRVNYNWGLESKTVGSDLKNM